MATIGVAVIVGDRYLEGLSTICSLLNQTTRADFLLVLENPQRNVRLSERFSQLSSLLAGAERQGTRCMVVPTSGLSLVKARELCEQLLPTDLLMISDDDHFYPVDYLERAHEALSAGGSGFFGCAIESLSSVSGFRSGSALELVQSASDYVAGGSFMYTKSLRDIWTLVSTYTEGYGEDRAWRLLAFQRGAERVGFYGESVLHLSPQDDRKYSAWVSAELAALSEGAGALTRPEF